MDLTAEEIMSLEGPSNLPEGEMSSNKRNRPHPSLGESMRARMKLMMKRRANIPRFTSKADYLAQRSKPPKPNLPKGNYVSAARNGQCRQNDHFSTGRVCHRNWLLYIIPPTGDVVFSNGTLRESVAQSNIKRRVCSAVAEAFFLEDPGLLLEGRSYFRECVSEMTSPTFAQHNLPRHLNRLIADHLCLCDWLEERLRLLKQERYEDVEYYMNDENSSFSDTNMIMPMLRSVIFLAWPTAFDEEGRAGVESVSLVLTGDDSRIKSGPLTFEMLSPDVEIGNKRVANLSLAKAVEFLTMVDKREVAANPELRSRNEACAERLRIKAGWTTSGLD